MSICTASLQEQSGYVLLVMLVLLMSVGGGWLSLTSSARQLNTLASSLSFDDQHSLVDARQALLSYAAVYPFLYGPAGAGSAHLPCPDTDGDNRYRAVPETGSTQSRDGPNPPCSSLLSSSGFLPRHIRLPGRQYAFHSQPMQRFQFDVAGAVVNNPLNRVVNITTLRQQYSIPGALISLMSPDGAATVGNVVIRTESMIAASVAGVAAWLIERVHNQPPRICAIPDESTISALASDVCAPSLPVQNLCEHEHLLTLILDKPLYRNNTQTCLAESLRQNTLEGVPASRHWFIRNQWHASIVFDHEQGCPVTDPQLGPCKLHYLRESRQAIAAGDWQIKLHWLLPV